MENTILAEANVCALKEIAFLRLKLSVYYFEKKNNHG